MQSQHHTYESLHKEHHVWRKDLLQTKKDLLELYQSIKKRLKEGITAEEEIICNELRSRSKLLLQEIENKLSSLTDTDKLMSKTDEVHHVVSQELFLINSRMRAGLIEFSKGCDRLKKDIESLG